MKNLAIALGVLILVGIGIHFAIPKTVAPAPDKPVGGSTSSDHYFPEYFRNGMYANLTYSLNTVNASSSSTTAANIFLALGSGAAGQITVGTSTPATRVVNASTTAISATTDMVFLQPTAQSSIAGVTCNALAPTSTVVSQIVASSSAPTLNGFQVTLGSIPTTNPVCLNYWILKKGN